MAHKKAGGSTNNGRDSNAKMRGVKKFGGEKVAAGAMLLVSMSGKGEMAESLDFQKRVREGAYKLLHDYRPLGEEILSAREYYILIDNRVTRTQH